MSTPLEDLLQDIYDSVSDPLKERVHKAIVHEACNDRPPLDKQVVLSIMEAIPDLQPFKVIFQKKNGDLRYMMCSINREEAKEWNDPPNTYTVYDQEAKAPRSFRLDSVYSIIIEA